jgi:hypothetical protein
MLTLRIKTDLPFQIGNDVASVHEIAELDPLEHILLLCSLMDSDIGNQNAMIDCPEVRVIKHCRGQWELGNTGLKGNVLFYAPCDCFASRSSYANAAIYRSFTVDVSF